MDFSVTGKLRFLINHGQPDRNRNLNKLFLEVQEGGKCQNVRSNSRILDIIGSQKSFCYKTRFFLTVV